MANAHRPPKPESNSARQDDSSWGKRSLVVILTGMGISTAMYGGAILNGDSVHAVHGTFKWILASLFVAIVAVFATTAMAISQLRKEGNENDMQRRYATLAMGFVLLLLPGIGLLVLMLLAMMAMPIW